MIPKVRTERVKYEEVSSNSNESTQLSQVQYRPLSSILIDNFVATFGNKVGLHEYYLNNLYEELGGNTIGNTLFLGAAKNLSHAIDGVVTRDPPYKAAPDWYTPSSSRKLVADDMRDKKEKLAVVPQWKLTIVSKVQYEACKAYFEFVNRVENAIVDDGKAVRFLSEEAEQRLNSIWEDKSTVHDQSSRFESWVSRLEAIQVYKDLWKDRTVASAKSKSKQEEQTTSPLERSIHDLKAKIQEELLGDVVDAYNRSSRERYHKTVLQFYKYCYERAENTTLPAEERRKWLRAPWFLFYDVLAVMKRRCHPHDKLTNIVL